MGGDQGAFAMIRRFILFSILFFSSSSFSAAPIPSYKVLYTTYRTASEACSAMASNRSGNGVQVSGSVKSEDENTFYCSLTSTYFDGGTSTSYGAGDVYWTCLATGQRVSKTSVCPDPKCSGSKEKAVDAYGGANTLITFAYDRSKDPMASAFRGQACDKNGCFVEQVSGGGGSNNEGTKYGLYGKWQMRGACDANDVSKVPRQYEAYQQKSADKTKDPVACASKGGSWGQVNGVDTCVPNNGSGNNTSSKTDTKKTTTNNADGTSTKVDVKTSTTCAVGTCTTTTTTTTQNYDSSGNAVGTPQTSSVSTVVPDQGGGAATGGGPAKGDKGSGSGSAPTSTSSAPASPSSAPAASQSGAAMPADSTGKDFYSKKDAKLSDKWDAFSQGMQDSPFISAAKSFFTLGGIAGTCPQWTYSVAFLKTSITFDAFCQPQIQAAMSLVGPVLMALAAWAAFKIAVM